MAPTNWVYVTGCDSGFGSIVVKDLAAKGFSVFAGHFLPASAETLKAAHASIVPVQVDISNQASVDAAAATVRKQIEAAGNGGAQLYGLVNNAGLMVRAGPIEWTPAENMLQMMQVNVIGMHRVTTSVLPLLRRSQGRIVNVASMAGVIALPTQTAYSASKFAVEGYSDGLRREIFDWGVSVHIIEPGVFKNTGLYSTYRDGVEKLWEGLTDEVRADYGDAFKDGIAKKANLALDLCSTNSGLVPKAMIEALTATHPRYRYMVGPDCNFLVRLNRWMHESWMDLLFRADPTGQVMGAAMDPNGRSVASRRYQGSGLMRSAFWLLVLYVLLKLRKNL